jgi:hypothetical protein
MQKAQPLVYHIGARLCDRGQSAGPGTTPGYLEDETKQVDHILSHSTIVLAPEIPQ